MKRRGTMIALVAKVLSWKGKTEVSSLAGKPVRLHFRMRSASLYAFQFEGESED